jgi:hypothetical protein
VRVDYDKVNELLADVEAEIRRSLLTAVETTSMIASARSCTGQLMGYRRGSRRGMGDADGLARIVGMGLRHS